MDLLERHRIVETHAIQSNSFAELDLKCAADGIQLKLNDAFLQDLVFLSLGYAESELSYNLSDICPNVGRYDFERWSQYFRHIANILKMSLQRKKMTEQQLKMLVKHLICFSADKLKHNQTLSQIEHRFMFYFDGKNHGSKYAAFILDILLEADGNSYVMNVEPLILLDVLNYLGIDNQYIEFSQGFNGTMYRENSLANEIYNSFVWKLQQIKEVIAVLLKHGANPVQKDKSGISFNDIVNINDVFYKKFTMSEIDLLQRTAQMF